MLVNISISALSLLFILNSVYTNMKFYHPLTLLYLEVITLRPQPFQHLYTVRIFN